ncbi:MAG TPA: PQQ-binding-like beta-propeller repeat protein, partial [Planctomycetaceae bacterium]|nr:PQQ-binding-like beta-propeller repeat protein [Planctomycetaceae bacterium]
AEPRSAAHRGWRQGGLSVAINGGLIVCPTQMGAVLCVDPATRSFVWVSEYPRTLAEHANGELYRWLPVDGIPRVTANRVLLAPADVNRVMCLDASDGHSLWSRPLPPAGFFHVAGDRVLIVGRREITAHQLADGSEVWRLSTPPPAGLGVNDGKNFYLPRRDGFVGVIDLEHGRLTGSFELPGGARPGNLIRIQGGILSQGLEDLAWRPDATEP